MNTRQTQIIFGTVLVATEAGVVDLHTRPLQLQIKLKRWRWHALHRCWSSSSTEGPWMVERLNYSNCWSLTLVVTARPATKAGATTTLEICDRRWHALHRWWSSNGTEGLRVVDRLDFQLLKFDVGSDSCPRDKSWNSKSTWDLRKIPLSRYPSLSLPHVVSGFHLSSMMMMMIHLLDWWIHHGAVGSTRPLVESSSRITELYWWWGLRSDKTILMKQFWW
jgi:hypothetical protein